MRLVIDWLSAWLDWSVSCSRRPDRFINRVGGSDTNALAALLEVRDMGGPEDCPLCGAFLI